MIGTQRSGSNLLRLMLDQGGSLLAPPSAHELRDLLPLASLYDPLSVSENRMRLANDLTSLVRLNALAWPNEHLDVSRLLSHLEGLSLMHFVLALYDQAAEWAARRGWVNKCLENVHYFDVLDGSGSALHYLHLVRDPRDVALSFQRAPIGPKDPRIIATTWRDDQRAALEISARHPDRTRVQLFEDLVLRPGENVAALSSWLGIPYSGAALKYHEREDAREAARLSPIWSNLTRPPMSDRAAAHTREPGNAEFLRQVEELVFDDMAQFGYEPKYATSPRCLPADEAMAAAENDAHLRAETVRAHSSRDQSAHLRREDLLAALRNTLRKSEESTR